MGFGIHLQDNEGNIYEITAFTFVDDNDLVQEISDISDCAQQPQKALDVWNESLQASGGACAPDKSSWTAIIHKWNRNNKWSLGSIRDFPGAITLKDDHGTRQTLQRSAPTDAALALGIMFSPSGQMNSHFKLLQSKCKVWANSINQSTLSRTEVFTAMQTTIWKTVEYSLLSTTFNYKQCSSLTSLILTAGLPKSGICRNISRKPLFSCTKFQGFGLRHPFFTQGIRKLELLLNTTDPTSAFLVRHAMETTSLECGLGNNFLTFNPSPLSKVIERTWAFSLWEFCWESNISITQNTPNELRHSSDGFLMHAFMNNHIAGRNLQILNYCRLHLRVELISDLFTTDNTRIRSSYWNGHAPTPSIDTRIWPNQPSPNGSAWKLWKHALQSTFHLNSNGTRNTQPSPIASFYPSKWTWFYDSHCNRIYERTSSNTTRIWLVSLARRNTRRRTFYLSSLHELDPEPNNLSPCTVIHHNTTISLESFLPTSAVATSPILTAHDELPKIASLIQTYHHGNVNALKNHFQNHELVIVSDGSSKDKVGAGAWIITSMQCYPQIYTEGSMISPGPA
jgi:hypothetical protein